MTDLAKITNAIQTAKQHLAHVLSKKLMSKPTRAELIQAQQQLEFSLLELSQAALPIKAEPPAWTCVCGLLFDGRFNFLPGMTSSWVCPKCGRTCKYKSPEPVELDCCFPTFGYHTSDGG